MNTNITPSRFVRMQEFKRVLSLLVVLSIQLPMFAVSARAEAIAALQGLTPMGTAELASHYGGMQIGNMNINLGFMIKTEVDNALGKNIEYTAYATGALPTGDSPAAATATIQTVNGVTKTTVTSNAVQPTTVSLTQDTQAPLPTIVSPQDMARLLQGATQTVITNQVNNAVITQVKNVTIDVSNLPSVNYTAFNGFRNLTSQINASIRHFH